MAVTRARELFCNWGGIKTNVNADFNLTKARVEQGESPMVMHAGNLSRFPITIVDKSQGETRIASANIPWNEVSAIQNKTLRSGIWKDMLTLMNDSASQNKEPLSPAYTVQITLGYFKGKTPAEVLQNPADKEKLISTKEFLGKNLDKYPGNKKVMDAIDDGIALLDAGKLNKENIGAGTTPMMAKPYIVYNAKYKNKKPYVGDMRTIYNISITCFPEKKEYPYQIRIDNCLAPMQKMANGTTLPDMANAKDKVSLTINLSEDGWIECADIMYRRLNQFEITHFPEMEAEMTKLAWSPDKATAKTVMSEEGETLIEDTGEGVKITIA